MVLLFGWLLGELSLEMLSKGCERLGKGLWVSAAHCCVALPAAVSRLSDIWGRAERRSKGPDGTRLAFCARTGKPAS